MHKELLWDLFKATGKVEYYLKYKKIEREENSDSHNEENK